MPTIEIRKALSEIKEYEVIIRGELPPVTVDSEGTVRYGKIGHIEYKGLDEDGNQAGNVYFHHEELSDEFKADLVVVLLKHLPLLAAEIGASFDLDPTPYEDPNV